MQTCVMLAQKQSKRASSARQGKYNCGEIIGCAKTLVDAMITVVRFPEY